MRKYITLLISACAVALLGACSTYINGESYALATQGHTQMEYSGFGCDQNTLRNATLLALSQRGWTTTDTNNPIQARISGMRQDARLSIDVQNDKLVIDTKGSLVDGNKAYVPMRYLNYLIMSVRENVLKAK